MGDWGSGWLELSDWGLWVVGIGWMELWVVRVSRKIGIVEGWVGLWWWLGRVGG